MNDLILRLAEQLYNFQRIDNELEKSDLLLVPCSNDLKLVDYIYELFKDGYAKNVLFSWWVAHVWDFLDTWWHKPEAEVFYERAIKLGIPSWNIYLEKFAKNTGENFNFSQKVIEKNNLDFESIIVVQKPFMQMRCYATFMKVWNLKYKRVYFTWPQKSFIEYLEQYPKKQELVNILVWDLQRLIEYPNQWFQVHVDIPEEILDAYKKLIEYGFNKHLIK